LFNIEDLLKAFEWQDFEIFLCQSLESFGFSALHTFRYTVNKKRHEVDIIGRDRQKILFIDAKHWNEKTASNGALYRVAQEQATRAEHLILDPTISGQLLQRLGVSVKDTFHTYLIYPIILVSSNLAMNTIINGIPIVSVLRFNEFLTNFSSIETMLIPIKLTKVVYQRKIQ
jgi:Holliday junction resolvase-like predicted endonuclease